MDDDPHHCGIRLRGTIGGALHGSSCALVLVEVMEGREEGVVGTCMHGDGWPLLGEVGEDPWKGGVDSGRLERV